MEGFEERNDTDWTSFSKNNYGWYVETAWKQGISVRRQDRMKSPRT